MGLYEKQKIKYLFDFGDEWVFDILVEKIDQEASMAPKPRITQVQGKSPEQYPDEDYDWDEE